MISRAGRVVLVVGALGLMGSLAWGDYYNPPPWQENPYFTHQSWDLSTSANPLPPDGGYSNPYGTPTAQLVSGVWMETLGYPGRTGGWMFQGPHTTSDLLARLEIPNTPHPELVKEIWFQATLQTNMLNLANDLMIRVFPNGQGPGVTAGDNVNVEILDLPNGLVRATLWFTLDEQPAFEVFELRGNMGAGDFFWVDQFDVDTRCTAIPEPASVALGGLAAMGLLLFWRRK